MRDGARRTLRRLALGALLAVCGTAVSGCQDGAVVPRTLADGTPATLSSVAFEGVEVRVVATRVKAPSGSSPADCDAAGRTIDRLGVTGASRTIGVTAAPELVACDWTATSGWCGVAFARLREEQLLDPRLSLTCRGAEREPVGFLWITPGRRTAFLVVADGDYAEAYPVVRGGPVRVTTDGVDIATSSVALTVSEHARDGGLLRIRKVTAQVSG